MKLVLQLWAISVVVLVVGCNDSNVENFDVQQSDPVLSADKEKPAAELVNEEGAYCFFEIRGLAERYSEKESTRELGFLRALYELHENGDLLLSVMLSKRIIYFAEPCDHPVAQPFLEQYKFTSMPTTIERYRKIYDQANDRYSRIDMATLTDKTPDPLPVVNPENRAYCFYEADGNDNESAVEVSARQSRFIEVINTMYENDEIMLPAFRVQRTVYYAEPCYKNQVWPIVDRKYLRVSHSSHEQYKIAYEQALSATTGFEIVDQE